MQSLFSRRRFLAAAATLPAAASLFNGAAASGTAAPGGPAPLNPLVRQRADAQIFRHGDGYYYLTASVPEYDRLIIRRSPTLAGLAADDSEAVVWRRPAGGKLGGYIWAPELHWVDGAWQLYFAAGDGGEPFRIRTYVLSCRDADPLTGRWTLLGQLQTPWDSFTLDSTLFSHRGVRYICWAQKEPGIETNSNLYLAPLASPTSLARPPARLTVPALDWEIQGYKVAEAPAVLARNGRLFITYSASATDARYCLGLLTVPDDADIMNPAVWQKSPQPVFVSSTETSVYGPGHNSFTVDEQGRDILVYHGRDYRAIKGNPLFDPNRHTRLQRLYYQPDGTPDFGVPVGNGPLPERFSPAAQAGQFLILVGQGLRIGPAALPATQFRTVPVNVGAESFLLSPILRPDLALMAGPGGTVTLAPRAQATALICQDAGGGCVRLVMAGEPGRALAAADERLTVAAAMTAAALWRVD
ncbi:glycoside hydrolase family 43 protein [Niveispirillum sp. BGYR6]|uniref:glycoside hydrolase family 43 protein n=1 Tax=Niveispirillum sp. BGYR6 TaxID=2971249 RepID=UPI0022B97941|nr:glycoside hydrolase family 43 protein [Niveispirillum sp. BGYR6]MDG5497957.1 glycoside hydrolase family 43 protein [Niveispirillum sp. BGYR6]